MSLNIYICEDNEIQRELITDIIEVKICEYNNGANLIISSSNPEDILREIKLEKGNNIYFLDIELKNSEFNGIELARMIREKDSMGYIVFVTTHSEMSILTFKYKLEALDFIKKDNVEDMKKSLINCIDDVNKRIESSNTRTEKYFKFKDITGKNNIIPYDNILFIETIKMSSRKVRIVCINKEIEFASKIVELKNSLGEDFFQCQRSILVNIRKIVQIDSIRCEIKLINGQICEISKQKIKDINKRINL